MRGNDDAGPLGLHGVSRDAFAASGTEITVCLRE